MSRKSAVTIYNILIYPHLSYCNITWSSTCPVRLESIFMIQKKIVRIMTFSSYKKRNKNNLYFFKNNEYIYELNKHFIAAVHCSGSSSDLHSQVLTDGRDVKRTNQDTIHYSKVVTFLATRNTDNSIKHRK